MQQIAFVCSPGLHANISVFDASTHTSRKATPDDIPWPAAYLVSGFSRRHRFVSKALPDVWRYVKAASVLESKLAWRLQFKDDHSGDKRRFKPSVSRPRPFNGICAPEITRWTKDLKGAIVDEFNVERRSLSRVWWSNRPELVRLGYRLISKARFYVLPADREGRHSLVLRDDIEREHCRILNNGCYEVLENYKLIDIHSDMYWDNALFAQYRGISKRIAAADSRTSMGSLTCSLCSDRRRRFSSLRGTVKDHKAPGKVQLRPIVSSIKHVFSSMGLWVKSVVDKEIYKRSWLVRSSEQFKARAEKLVFPRSKRWGILHVDLDDLFNVGAPEFLAKESSLTVGTTLRKLVHEAISFLLAHQFVTTAAFGSEEDVWRMIRGAGMGTTFAAAVANAAFQHSQELCGARLAHRPVQVSLGVFGYFRYVDNLLFFVEDLDRDVPRVLDYLGRHLSYPFKVEEFSSHSLKFLDLMLSKSVAGGLEFEPHVANNGRVLDPGSSHPISVHASWPLAMLRRYARLASRSEIYDTAREKFFHKLIWNGYPPDIVKTLSELSSDYFSSVLSTSSRAHGPKSDVVWLVVPFHPFCHGPLRRAVRKLNDRVHQQMLGTVFQNDGLRLRLSYRLNGPGLGQSFINWN